MRKVLSLTGFFIGLTVFSSLAEETAKFKEKSAQDLPGVDQRSDFQGKMFEFKGTNEFTSQSSRPKLATGFKSQSSLSPDQSASGFDKRVSLKEFSVDKKFPAGESSLGSREQKFFQIQKRYETSQSSSMTTLDRAREEGKKSRLDGKRYKGPEAEALLQRSDKEKGRILGQTELEEGGLSVEQIREILNKN